VAPDAAIAAINATTSNRISMPTPGAAAFSV
jgi:hypothetical protein